MGDQRQRHPALGVELQQQVEHLRRRGAVEAAGRLVGQQQVRLHDQRPAQRGALPLAARQLARLVPQAAGEPDPRQQPPGLLQGLRGRDPREAQRQRRVLLRGELRQQVVLLVDEAQVPVAQRRQRPVRQPVDAPPGQLHRARVRAVEAGQQVQQGALAAAGHADHGRALAGGELEVEAAQHLDPQRARAEGLGEPRAAQHRLTHSAAPPPAAPAARAAPGTARRPPPARATRRRPAPRPTTAAARGSRSGSTPPARTP